MKKDLWEEKYLTDLQKELDEFTLSFEKENAYYWIRECLNVVNSISNEVYLKTIEEFVLKGFDEFKLNNKFS